jgi:putative sterol carrier protein
MLKDSQFSKQFLKGEHSYLATRFATILLRTDLYQLFSNADRSYERNYANSWRNDQLEAAVVVLMKQMINRSAKSNMSIVEDVRDQDANPFGNRTSNKRKVKFFTLNHFQSLSKEDHLRFKAATIIFASTKTIYFQFLR